MLRLRVCARLYRQCASGFKGPLNLIRRQKLGQPDHDHATIIMAKDDSDYALYIIPYDAYGTLYSDNIASCAYDCRLYYKDASDTAQPGCAAGPHHIVLNSARNTVARRLDMKTTDPARLALRESVF